MIKKSKYLALYVISTALLVVAILFDQSTLYLVTKPLLMISLLGYFISASSGYPTWRIYVVIALLFSLAGDVLMMFSSMFIGGLASFLIAHVCYIAAYLKTGADRGRLSPVDITKFVILGIVMTWLLYTRLNGMLIPVLLYTLVLVTMGLLAHKRRGATYTTSFRLASTGASLFVISDCLIAINRFVFEIPAGHILIMSTYIVAQYLIIQGLIKHLSPA